MSAAPPKDSARELGQTDPKPGRYGAGLHPAKRDQILDGAHRVFSHLGFDAAGMADITREAGVSKGTIYVYFESKDELFAALMDRERERMFRDIEIALAVEGTTRQRLLSYGCTLARVLCSGPVVQAHRVVIGVAERKPQLAEGFYNKGARRGGALLQGFLTEEIAAGRLRIPDLELAAAQFIELCMAGLFRQRLLGYMPEAPSEARIAVTVGAAVEMFLSAYGSDEGTDG